MCKLQKYFFNNMDVSESFETWDIIISQFTFRKVEERTLQFVSVEQMRDCRAVAQTREQIASFSLYFQ